jgi:outer membrane protein TolC
MGYLYDSFVVSGNQQHSVNLSLSTPLSFIDRGQAGAQAAQARARRYAEQRRLALAASAARSEALRRALQMQRQRLRMLQEQVVPRGQAILRDVRRAFEARSVPLTDLNQAQRALDELLLQEATALSDVFRLCVDLIELGGEQE